MTANTNVSFSKPTDSRIRPGLFEKKKTTCDCLKGTYNRSQRPATYPDGSDADVSDDLPRNPAAEFLMNPSSIGGIWLLFHPFFEFSLTDPLRPGEDFYFKTFQYFFKKKVYWKICKPNEANLVIHSNNPSKHWKSRETSFYRILHSRELID